MLAVAATTASTWTAIGTLALAVATLLAVIVGAIALWQNRAAFGLSRNEVEEAHRPVVVPVADRRRMDPAGPGGMPGLARPKIAAAGELLVPVENIGTGPAVTLEARIDTWLTESGEWSAIGVGQQTSAMTAGLGIHTLLPLEIKVPKVSDVSGFVLTLTYTNVAGQAWTTSARYIPTRERYENVTITQHE
jgi:hypothetical protein